MQIRILISILLLAVASAGGISIPVDEHQEVSSDDLVEEFKSNIYPLFARTDGGCFDCHSTDDNSDLIFSGNAEEDLHMLIDGQYLNEKGPDSLLSRLTSSNDKLRMPQDADAWSKDEIERLATFVRSVENDKTQKDVVVDERFPRALLQPYRGEQLGSIDNQFISFRQLKSKTAVIFEDDWVRGSKDLFAENVSLFGGADFKTRFNETREPRAAFLTGLEMLANDVAHQAYERKLGPFDNWPSPSTSPLETEEPTREYRKAITRLYESVLFRSPTNAEIEDSYRLLREIYQAADLISSRNHGLAFELAVSDPQTNLQRKQIIEIPVIGDRLEVHQQIVNQAKEAISDEEPMMREVIGPIVELKPDNEVQRLVVHNLATMQNVSFAGVELAEVDLEDEPLQTISVSSSDLQLDGAWELVDRRGTKSLEDRNHHKGRSTIAVPLSVAKAGRYRVTMLWRADPGNADNVLVELYAAGAGDTLASSFEPVVPTRGEAHFDYDCGEDSVAFFQPTPAFQFDDKGYVEISNRGTRNRVTAGAVEFIERSEASRRFLIDSLQAEGNEQWNRFDEGRFKAYNVKGKKLHDDNKKKGELKLRYTPAAKVAEDESEKKSSPEWDPDRFYDVRIYFPGKANQESQVPVVIKAAKSSPLIQLKHPLIAKSDARLRLDASASYTVQHSDLQFSWRQISGAPVELGGSNRSALEFTVPPSGYQTVCLEFLVCWTDATS